jgi:GNAT superfamily N-acetyltransferase
VSELQLRPAGEDEDDAIAECIGISFPNNPKADPAVLRWQYRDNPYAPTRRWVWDDGGQIVAHYSAFAMGGVLDGKPALIANAVDAAVHPEHQGRRLFTPLARALYDDCAAHDLPVAVCFATNDIALRGVSRAGFQEIGRLRALVTAFDDRWLADRFHVPAVAVSPVRRLAFRTPRTSDHAEVVTSTPEDVSDLWDRVASDVRFGVRRDATWWRWRYDAAPLPYTVLTVRRGGTLVGATAVRVLERFGGRFAYLLELVAVDAGAGAALVAGVRQQFPDAVGAVTLTSEGSVQERMARAAGLRPLPRRLEPHPARYGAVDTDGAHASATVGGWHIGWGDLDHV